MDWTDSFQRTLDRLEALKTQDDPDAAETLNLLDWQLEQLENLDSEPIEETPTFKEVRQRKRYPIWRVSHPYIKGKAIRTIVWFTDSQHAVVALFANDKAPMGDVFYDSVGSRADAEIEAFIREHMGELR